MVNVWNRHHGLGFLQSRSETQFGVQDVYWDMILESTLEMEGGGSRNRQREKSNFGAGCITSAHLMSSGIKMAHQSYPQLAEWTGLYATHFDHSWDIGHFWKVWPEAKLLYSAETFLSGLRAKVVCWQDLPQPEYQSLPWMWDLGRAFPCYHTLYIILSAALQSTCFHK